MESVVVDMCHPRHIVEDVCQAIRGQIIKRCPQIVRDGIVYEAEPGQCRRHSDIRGLCAISPEGMGPGRGAGGSVLTAELGNGQHEARADPGSVLVDQARHRQGGHRADRALVNDTPP
ncbi:hypothetical protein [Streptomyces sp. SP18CS02]|uniref:hypothetical protein n=1 Tax=Streptomyces sp. SP18CS02 TaxID=3002531 RepID=UPI002E796265|nr:hypothetical protein [Streptomyces sp. SP18CS02]MEE1753067.1 hypothetical protein [Streptomyces sp. SP18CS02]